MGLTKMSTVKGISILLLVYVCFTATSSFADMTFLLMDYNDPNKAVVEIKDNKAYLTVVEMKNGKWSSNKVSMNEYCKQEVGIVVTNIQGINLKTDTKLCRCVTTENFLVFIARYKDGKITILQDSEGNYNIEEKLKDKNKKVTGIQYISAKVTPDGRLELQK